MVFCYFTEAHLPMATLTAALFTANSEYKNQRAHISSAS